MRILLVGAMGNLGQAIIGVSDFEIIQLNKEDLGQIDQLMSLGIDLVIHAAGDLKNKITEKPVSIIDSNVRITARLIESMRRCGVARLFYISSCAVYGKNSDTYEEIKELPTTLNGLTKLLNERIIEDFCSANKINYTIFRVFNLYGKNDCFSIFSNIKKSIENNAEFNLNNNGIAQRDFIHVDDAASIILKVANANSSFNYLNLGTGVATKVGDIVKAIQINFPQLRVNNTFLPEVEYSRANIGRILKIINHNFIEVDDFIRNVYVPSLK